LSKSMRRSLKSLLGVSVAVVFGGALLIQHLYQVVDYAELKQKELASESQTLGDELANLQDLKQTLENDLSDREERIALV
ncbi:M23 family metallopeptidase, partial [Vibrio alfacsensis]